LIINNALQHKNYSYLKKKQQKNHLLLFECKLRK